MLVIAAATKTIIDTNESPTVIIVVREIGGFVCFMNTASLDVRQCTTCMNSRFKRFSYWPIERFWEGRINRADLTRYFGISTPQASADLGRYQDGARQHRL